MDGAQVQAPEILSPAATTELAVQLRASAADLVRLAAELEERNLSLATANWRLESCVAERTAALDRALALARHDAARFRAVAETVPQLVWTSHPEGRWDYASPRWVAYTGQPEPTTHALGWLESIHPEDREHTMAAWHDATVRKGLFRAEHRIRAADGSYRWFETTALPVADGEQRPVSEWVGASADVHARKLAEMELQRANARLVQEAEDRRRELARSEARMAAFFAAAPEPLFVVAEAPGGRFLHEAVNPACERLTGWRTESVRGQPARGFMPLESAGAAEAAYRRCRDLGVPTGFEAVLREGGPPLRVSLLLVATDDAEGDDGHPARLLGFIRAPADAAEAPRGTVVPFPLPRPGHLQPS